MITNYTEQYVQSDINNINEWYSLHSDELTSLRSSINQFLSVNTDNSIYTLCTFLNNQTIMKTFYSISDIAYCIYAADITASEFNSQVSTVKFMNNAPDINALINKVQYYKFLILNIEYDVERTTAIQTIIEKVSNNEISLIALFKLIYTIAVDKAAIIEILTHNLRLSGMSETADILNKLFKNMENEQ